MNSPSTMNAVKKIDYGVDAPGVLRGFFISGLLTVGVGWWLRSVPTEWLRVNISPFLVTLGGWLFLSGVLMFLYVKYGKFIHRDRMLGRIQWRGDESVLDVGTGRGLLLVGAAKKLKTGRAIGIDVWSQIDMAANSEANTLANILAEGVQAQAAVQEGDARKMSFPESSFDIVLSNLCLHNISDAEGRRQACLEIARVLKPGGTALISDFMKTKEYVAAFREAGLSVERSLPYWIDTFPPLRIVTAKKH